MEIIIFLVVLVVLIVVHELGHFFAARWMGMHVEEFGIGYPPRAWGKKIGDTLYSLNWLPLGGFVKIQGEDGELPQSAESPIGDSAEKNVKIPGKSMTDKSHVAQLFVLVAGVVMNVLLAYVVLSITLMMGMPRALHGEHIAEAPDARLIVGSVAHDSPAYEAGIRTGDEIVHAYSGLQEFDSVTADSFVSFIQSTETGEAVALRVKRGDEEMLVSAIPEAGTVPSEPTRRALGISLSTVGTVKLNPLDALVEGGIYTWELTKLTTVGLIGFFGSIVTLNADLSQVSGPVGIAGAVGDASKDGIISLLFITALISINLAVINLLPIPALDGGRILFVLIEMISRKPIPAKYTMWVNGVGFALLLLLMLVVTVSDVLKLF